MNMTILVIIATVILTAFFSGMEIAYLTSNKLRIELKNKRGVLSGRIFSFFLKHPSHFFTTTLVGNNVALVLYSIYFSALVSLLLAKMGWIVTSNVLFLLQTIIGSIVILIIGEFLPKALFRSSPNTLLGIFSLPFILCYYLLYPLVIVIVFLSQAILRLVFRTRISKQEPEFTRYDLFHYVAESKQSDEEKSSEVDKQIFQNAIEFHSIKVRDCMIPRTEIDAIEVTDSIENLRQKYIESGHSKLPVFRESIDNVIGYAHLVDLYKSPKSIDKIVMPIIITTEATPASELLKQFIDKRRSMAVVVDEFGGTSGIITIEDIIEEIIGDIEDEHDVDDTVEKVIDENEYIFSARLEIDYLNEKYGLKLPEGDYETLGGLIMYIHQSIPKEGDVISVPPFEFTIQSTEQTRIKEVYVHVLIESNGS